VCSSESTSLRQPVFVTTELIVKGVTRTAAKDRREREGGTE
jgi:hypothetical protein